MCKDREEKEGEEEEEEGRGYLADWVCYCFRSSLMRTMWRNHSSIAVQATVDTMSNPVM